MEGKLKMSNKKTGKMVSKHFQLCDKKLISYKISVNFLLIFYDIFSKFFSCITNFFLL